MSSHLESLAWHIDRFGFDGTTQQHLHDLRSAADQAGVRPDLTDLVVDESAPAVARSRAFGHIATFIARHFRATDTTAAVSTTREAAPATTVPATDEQVACAA